VLLCSHTVLRYPRAGPFARLRATVASQALILTILIASTRGTQAVKVYLSPASSLNNAEDFVAAR
ncbi:MAG: hypothetical protein ACKVK8_10085, partial [Rhodospirillales bacterium]